MSKPKPGPGWTRNGPCWDHTSGLRIHPYGTIRLSSGIIHTAALWPNSATWGRFTRICGGNRRRGLMVYALTLEATT